MTSIRTVRFALAGLALMALTAPNAWAQNDPPVTVTGGIDFTNQYNFRGIRQNASEVSIWPFVDVGIAPWSGDGALKTIGVNLGIWNAVHTELEDNRLYETDFYGTLAFGFGRGALGFTYTSYTSPGDYFAHVKELAIKASFDDSDALGGAALGPYALVAFELSDDGQADGGAAKGTYVELGVAPGYSGARASVAVPIKVGLSADDYYEFGTGSDSKFGFFSIAGVVTVPLGEHFNVHGGVELQAFGDNVKIYNGFGDGDRATAGIASIGVGFSF